MFYICRKHLHTSKRCSSLSAVLLTIATADDMCTSDMCTSAAALVLPTSVPHTGGRSRGSCNQGAFLYRLC